MDNPCFCIPLRRGIIFIAALDIVVGVLGASFGILGIFGVIYSPHKSSSSNITDVSFTTTTTTTTQIPIHFAANGEPNITIAEHQAESEMEEDLTDVSSSRNSSKNMIFVLLVMFIIYSILQSAFGIVLLCGMAKEKLILLKAYLGFRASGALFTLATLVAFLFLGSQATIQPSIFDGVSLLISIYCIYVVYILAIEIKHSSTGKSVKPKPFQNDGA